MSDCSSQFEADKPVLDVACGAKMFYFDKLDSRVHFNDLNPRGQELCDGRHFVCSPDTDYDFTDLPFEDNSFPLVVFDPPHLERAGDKSYMAIKYGKLGEDWRETLRKGFAECFRVLSSQGTLVFKWCEYQIPLREVLALTDEVPVFGNRNPKGSGTHWLVFTKSVSEVD